MSYRAYFRGHRSNGADSALIHNDSQLYDEEFEFYCMFFFSVSPTQKSSEGFGGAWMDYFE
jgi:hypothetical protein